LVRPWSAASRKPQQRNLIDCSPTKTAKQNSRRGGELHVDSGLKRLLE
jgi:hypothetical protein